MVEPCSTMSMVINPYEIKNRTVSRGSKVCFFGAMGATVGMAVLPNKVVKWHSGLGPRTAGFAWVIAARTPTRGDAQRH